MRRRLGLEASVARIRALFFLLQMIWRSRTIKHGIWCESNRVWACVYVCVCVCMMDHLSILLWDKVCYKTCQIYSLRNNVSTGSSTLIINLIRLQEMSLPKPLSFLWRSLRITSISIFKFCFIVDFVKASFRQRSKKRRIIIFDSS